MRKIILLFLLLITCRSSFSQSSEVGIMVGISSYKGDLSSSLFNLKFFHLAVGGHYRHCYNNNWSLKLGLNYGTISADDAESSDPFQLYRNLSFKSHVLEAEGQFEFNFFPFQTANPATTATPFVFAGLAIYKFNPKALLGDTWYDLQPLGTEGQGIGNRRKYKRLSVSLPFGGGFKFRLNQRFGISIEAGARRTFTDYLDDVSTTYPKKDVLLAAYGPLSVALSDRSIDQLNDNNNDRQRGDAAHKDWYMFAGISLNYTLSRKYNDACRPFKRKLH